MFKQRYFILVVIFLLMLVTSGCGGANQTTVSESIEAAQETEKPTDLANVVSPIAGAACEPTATLAGEPIVIGGSLSLTGILAPTANIHRVVGEVVADWINLCGGLLGRPVEWMVLDDQSVPENAATNYERLTTIDKVDLVIGPYGAANILASAAPVGRAGYIFPTHTNGAPQSELGDFHFPAWQVGGGADTAEGIFQISSDQIWDALESSGHLPRNAFYVTNKFPYTVVFTEALQNGGEARGIETIDSLEYDLGTTDFSAIALRIRAGDPDFVFVGTIGLDINNLYDAFATIGYAPHGIGAAVPSPGPVLALGEQVEGLLVLSLYEDHAPFRDNPIAAEFSKRFVEAATADELLPLVETQAAASFGAWQILFTAVTNTQSLDHSVLKEWLLANQVETIAGTLTFDGFNGYGVDHSRVVQIQNGKRYVIWPPELAPEGISIQFPNE
ncbi:ABC transporter substrate-binding protein [Chloroflexi bacterium TSY]|nr:ABC transporter substrate-binding protein [Chloroflexi bacterium TSY]